MNMPQREKASKSAILECVRRSGTQGKTIPEVILDFPGVHPDGIRNACRRLLDDERMYRPGERRDGAYVMRLGKHPEGKILRRAPNRSIPDSTKRLLRNIERAINRRELTGPKASDVVRAIREHLS